MNVNTRNTKGDDGEWRKGEKGVVVISVFGWLELGNIIVEIPNVRNLQGSYEEYGSTWGLEKGSYI